MLSDLLGPDYRGVEPRRHVLGPVTVSRVGFGAMQLPGPGVFGPPRDRTAAIAVLRRAVELGVDIDTAQYYGPGVANELIRAALYPCPAGLALVSKVGARRDAAGGVCDTTGRPSCGGGSRTTCAASPLAVSRSSTCAWSTARRPGQYFDDQLAAMVAAREDGLIGGIGPSNITPGHLRRALAITGIACVQNLLNLAGRRSMPVLEQCHARGIAFVPFFPPGSGFARGASPAPAGPAVAAAAASLGCTPAQVALAWLLDLRPEVLLIPGTSSISHLEENMAAANIDLDTEARDLVG
jgi:pyridoxine 4-dehydrogenase